jgi:S1-C subfamily serine protease
MEQIIQTGSVTRGWIGVEVQAITADLADSFGLPSADGTLISGVMRGSPADKAGVRPGDVLMAVDGRKAERSANHAGSDRSAGARRASRIRVTSWEGKARPESRNRT